MVLRQQLQSLMVQNRGGSSARLPAWLDNFLYTQLGAAHKPGENVDYNVDNDDAQNLRYLGTYFPRTLVESWMIMNDLLESAKIRNLFESREMHILDIGSGTGGCLAGLLFALKMRGLPLDRIYLYAVDGNLNALHYQKLIISKLHSQGFEIHTAQHRVYKSRFDGADGARLLLEDTCRHFGRPKFDMIMCSKFICETGQPAAKDRYKGFLETAEKRLQDKGLLYFVDKVAGPMGNRNRKMMTENILRTELRRYLQTENPAQLVPILPIPCHYAAAVCNNIGCYTERRFTSYFSKKKYGAVSKVIVRILAHKVFAQDILAQTRLSRNTGFQVNFNMEHPATCCNGRFVCTKEAGKSAHGYKLKKAANGS